MRDSSVTYIELLFSQLFSKALMKCDALNMYISIPVSRTTIFTIREIAIKACEVTVTLHNMNIYISDSNFITRTMKSA